MVGEGLDGALVGMRLDRCPSMTGAIEETPPFAEAAN
jgi:hypothetical protein